jgi:hypothetical protein
VGHNTGITASYDLYYYKAPRSTYLCGGPGPDETQFTLVGGASRFPTNSTAIAYADIGIPTPEPPLCVWFALRLVYPSGTCGAGAKTSMFLSANSPVFCVGPGCGGAVSMYDLKAMLVRAPGPKAKVDVSWKVSLESGVDHYSVYRAYTPTGPWKLVGSLSASNCANYDFIDNTGQPVGIALHSFYKVGAVDIENKESMTRAVKVTKK